MDIALNEVVVPALQASGFKGSFPHFRRPSFEAIDLLTFQFDKWGGGFVIEIARCSAEGYHTHWGKHIPPSKVRAWDLNPSLRYRVPPISGDGMDAWFRFDSGHVREIASQVISSLPEAESWWRSQAQQGAAPDRFPATSRQQDGS